MLSFAPATEAPRTRPRGLSEEDAGVQGALHCGVVKAPDAAGTDLLQKIDELVSGQPLEHGEVGQLRGVRPVGKSHGSGHLHGGVEEGGRPPLGEAWWLSFRPGHGLRKSPQGGPHSSCAGGMNGHLPARPPQPRATLVSDLSPPYPDRPFLLQSAGQQDFGPHPQTSRCRENPASCRENQLPGPPGSPVRSTGAWPNGKRTASWKGHVKMRERVNAPVSSLATGEWSCDKTNV